MYLTLALLKVALVNFTLNEYMMMTVVRLVMRACARRGVVRPFYHCRHKAKDRRSINETVV